MHALRINRSEHSASEASRCLVASRNASTTESSMVMKSRTSSISSSSLDTGHSKDLKASYPTPPGPHSVPPHRPRISQHALSGNAQVALAGIHIRSKLTSLPTIPHLPSPIPHLPSRGPIERQRAPASHTCPCTTPPTNDPILPLRFAARDQRPPSRTPTVVVPHLPNSARVDNRQSTTPAQ